MPASSQLNRQKSDRVPSEVMLRGAQTRIQDWWAQAYDGVLCERFRLEAQASLPLVGGGAGVEEVYAGYGRSAVPSRTQNSLPPCKDHCTFIITTLFLF